MPLRPAASFVAPLAQRVSLPRAAPIAFRSLHASPIRSAPPPAAPPNDEADDPSKGSTGFLGAIFYGSKQAKEEGLVSDHDQQGQHSKLVGRGKYVHEKVTHAVIPSHREEYLQVAEKLYRHIMDRGHELGGVKLTGSWETVIGSVGDFTHILEYEGYKGFDAAMTAFRGDKNSSAVLLTAPVVALRRELQSLAASLLPHLVSRQHQIVQEFSFWPSSPPRDAGYTDGGVFEMRTYELMPGKLLEWEGAWRRGLEARRRFVVSRRGFSGYQHVDHGLACAPAKIITAESSQPVGAFFSQVGQLHEVHHIWQYPDMDTRKHTREQAWSVGSWSDTVQETVKLTRSMKSTIMKPCPWSPLR
ncbi:hypothetical protein JCM24511_02588 [Saitozyma sp. JCM 24511]|nr:hypothetical protein JCM24511_02588 [Saitozyma sp. JCM 24511]